MLLVNLIHVSSLSLFYLLVIGVVLLSAYLYTTWTYSTFKKRKIPFLKPFPLLGNMASMAFHRESMAECVQKNYKLLKGYRFGGVFQFRNPIIMIRDPEIIKHVCVKDFDYFMNHCQFMSKKTDPLFSKSLFALSDKRWRDMRATLSPAFTSSKMKGMYLLISDCGRQARDFLKRTYQENAGGPQTVFPIEMKDFFTRFATDVIATSAFGVKCDSLKQPKNEFYTMGKEITTVTGLKSFYFIVYSMLPKVAELLGISFISKEATDFFVSMVHETISTREREGIVRPDLLHLMKEASKAGEHDPSKIKLDEDDIAAQAVLFFFAGFDTVTILMCFCTYLLAKHPRIQKRLQQEIDAVLDEHNDELSYEALHSMKYLDMVVSETLRLYPPSPAADRLCTRSLSIPATDTQPSVTFLKGDNLWLPIYALHHDPEHYPDPEKFDPERFSEERKESIKPFTYLPFGLGPRMCLAQRFALMEAKVVLIYLLSYFTIHEVDKTPNPMKLSKTSFNVTSENGFWCGVKLRNTEK